jgi:hypothetical protein
VKAWGRTGLKNTLHTLVAKMLDVALMAKDPEE